MRTTFPHLFFTNLTTAHPQTKPNTLDIQIIHPDTIERALRENTMQNFNPRHLIPPETEEG